MTIMDSILRAKLSDIRPGVRVKLHVLDHGADEMRTKEFIVTTAPNDQGVFYTLDPEAAEQYSQQQIENGQLNGVGTKRVAAYMGLMPTPKLDTIYCTVE